MKRSADVDSKQALERPIYYVSERPEAYDRGTEVTREEAQLLAQMIAENARRRFPQVEFRVDSDWHVHDSAMNDVAEYVESHWQAWAADIG